MKLKEEFAERSNDEEIFIHDLEDDEDKVNQGMCASDWFILTKKHLEALKNGKVLQLSENGWEYAMFIKYEGERE